MATTNKIDVLISGVQEHAFQLLSATERQTTNLHIDQRVFKKGELLGPEFQKIVVQKDSLLVFADDKPLANFGHDCRYILYDATSGEYYATIPARFPYYRDKKPATLNSFHTPVQFQVSPVSLNMRPIARCPIIRPDGERYAILYSGMSNMRHLNDMEFCYRMLIDRYGFDKNNIYVLNYDGTRNTQDGLGVTWVGDNTPFRIQVTGQGNRAGLQAVLNIVKTKIKSPDLLFFHSNNHGDNFGPQSFLCEYNPNWGQYLCSDFCTDIKVLPKFQSFIVMMEQCNSGGFNAPVIAANIAVNTSIASAAISTQSSWASADGNWDSFAHDWIAAQIGHEPNGGPLAHNPDTNGNGAIEAIEAFNYALSVKNPNDTPNFNQSSAAGGNITLNQQYTFWWIWCWYLIPIVQKYYATLPPVGPDPEFYTKINEALPELQKLILPSVEQTINSAAKELTPQIEAIMTKVFGK